MVISVYLLKETREKSVTFDEMLFRQDSGSGRLEEGLAAAAAAALSPGPRLDSEPSEKRQRRERSQCLAPSKCSISI